MSTRMRDTILISTAGRAVNAAINVGINVGILRRLAVVAAVVAAGVAVGVPCPAVAQQVAVIVNGAPITTYDIEQRTKFNTVATHKTPTRQEVVEELIDEKLKVQSGQRYRLEVTDAEVEAAYANMGQRMHLSPQQLTQALEHAGVDSQTLKSKIRSDIAWQQIVRGKFQSSLQISDKAVAAKLATGTGTGTGNENNQEAKKDVGYEYTLRPILFLTPNGASEGPALDARKRDAEGLRIRFQNCKDGLAFARALRDVAVRDQIVKSSADLAPALRKILDDVEVGKLTPMEVTPQGVQMFALCEKKENKLDASDRARARDELFAAQFQEKAKLFLATLRKSAMIEVK
jgi:peptidyl-prolyl cis-trans isomerase SurA